MCSIICEKSRGVEDELNTMVGGAAAGGLFMIPSKFELAIYYGYVYFTQNFSAWWPTSGTITLNW